MLRNKIKLDHIDYAIKSILNDVSVEADRPVEVQIWAQVGRQIGGQTRKQIYDSIWSVAHG